MGHKEDGPRVSRRGRKGYAPSTLCGNPDLFVRFGRWSVVRVA